ncbi:uncharacterized protein BJ212DRAFT_1486592 [Suillus subaureus]|uniref:Uncharacterized protein n=1 Tax=Suillus subaureus TaxID=48587 RepID=A0A9P7DWB3_9AGAM|nr:uncharacterized protein BJ212DRAFT_1486592 [Suillus subaureus]KAG1804666.1 hypothetical protein BJ212DRAFT_1486592 [Suillus subaureus]
MIPSVQPGSSHSASHTVVDGPSSSVILQTLSEVSLDELIMLLSPSQTKKLKVYVNQVTEETGCPQEVLHKFIDARSIFHMLIDLKATLYKRNKDQEKTTLLELKELIDSKDFKSVLQSCLTACLLSPNITTYVTDMHTNIMNFTKNHHEVFKLPTALIQDVELLAQLLKMVSELLSSICGNLKPRFLFHWSMWAIMTLTIFKLVTSIIKHMSIMDLAKSLAHSIIEVEACHWNRYTFLQCCLQIFLIGVSDYKAISLKDLYSNSLIPSLHGDLHTKIAMALNCEAGMEADKNDKQHTNHAKDDMDYTNDQCPKGEPGVRNDASDDGDLGGGEHMMDNGEEDQFHKNQDEETTC